MKSYLSENLYIDKKSRHAPYCMPYAHSHQSYELYYLGELNGEAYITINDKQYPLESGCVVIIDSDIPHQTNYHQVDYYQRFLLEISPKFLTSELGKVIGTPIDLFFQQYTGVHYLDKHTSTHIENVLMTIYNESIFKEKYYEDIVLLRILEIILLLDRNSDQLSIENTLSHQQLKSIRPVVRYIIENVQEPFNLASLANQFYLNKSYLSRIFKAYTGHTVHEFINLKKIEKAQRILLLEADNSIQNIGNQLGFTDAAYFSKIFKKYVGVTPTKFRKNNINDLYKIPQHNPSKERVIYY